MHASLWRWSPRLMVSYRSQHTARLRDTRSGGLLCAVIQFTSRTRIDPSL